MRETDTEKEREKDCEKKASSLERLRFVSRGLERLSSRNYASYEAKQQRTEIDVRSREAAKSWLDNKPRE